MFRPVPPLSAAISTQWSSIDLSQRFLLAHPHRQGVKSSDEKSTQDKDAAKTKLSQSTEFRQIIEEYAIDLREIIKKLRKRPN
jgi:hypothetical protein